MNVKSENIKSVIQSRLAEMCESRREFLSNASFLSCLGVEVNNQHLDLGKCVECVVSAFIRDLCKRKSLENSNGLPAEISIDTNLYKIITEKSASEGLRNKFINYNDDSSIEYEINIINDFLSEIDFKKIEELINYQSNRLIDSGLNILAKVMAEELKLKVDGRYSPYKKGSRVICSSWPIGFMDSFSKMKNLMLLKNGLSIIEDNGQINIGRSMDDFMSAINDLSFSNERIKPKSIFGKGGHLEIYCFKEKMEYRFSVELFDSLVAFLMINGEEEAAELAIKRTSTKEAA